MSARCTGGHGAAPGPGARPARRRPPSALVLAAGAPLLTGCLFADPPPPPENAPIEVVATSSVKPDEDCLLNRDEVGAGPHQVVLISEQGPADVRVLDETGRPVFEGHVEPQDGEHLPEEVEAHEVPPTPLLRLAAGTYRVECTPEGGPTSTADLRVVPARPGFEDIAPDG